MTSFMKTYVIAKLELLKTAMQKRNIKASAVWSDQVQVHITVNEELIDWWINLDIMTTLWAFNEIHKQIDEAVKTYGYDPISDASFINFLGKRQRVFKYIHIGWLA